MQPPRTTPCTLAELHAEAREHDPRKLLSLEIRRQAGESLVSSCHARFVREMDAAWLALSNALESTDDQVVRATAHRTYDTAVAAAMRAAEATARADADAIRILRARVAAIDRAIMPTDEGRPVAWWRRVLARMAGR